MVGTKCEHCFSYYCDRCRDDPSENSCSLFTEHQKNELNKIISEWLLRWIDPLNQGGSIKAALRDLKHKVNIAEIKDETIF